MNSIHDVADYIILRVKSEDETASLINLKLQKLLYYVQAWSYGINNKPMFDGEFEAWIHGPVNRAIYDRFSPTKYLYSEINIADCRNKNVKLSDEDAEFIDFILENYLKSQSPLDKCGGISIFDTPFLFLEDGRKSTAGGLTVENLFKMLN